MKLDDDEIFDLANALFPADGALAVFNLMFEMHNGKLACDDPEALRAIGVPGAKIAGYCAFIDLGDGKNFHSCRTFKTELDETDVLEGLLAIADAMPEESAADRTKMVQLSRFPSGNAAVAAWLLPDGTVRHAIYRHPDLPAARASTILKATCAVVRRERGKREADIRKN